MNRPLRMCFVIEVKHSGIHKRGMIQYAVEIALVKGHHWQEPKESSCEKFETKT